MSNWYKDENGDVWLRVNQHEGDSIIRNFRIAKAEGQAWFLPNVIEALKEAFK